MFFSTLTNGFSCHVRSNQQRYAIIIEIVYHFQQSQLILSFSSSVLCEVCCVWPITLCYCVHECGPRDMTKSNTFLLMAKCCAITIKRNEITWLNLMELHMRSFSCDISPDALIFGTTSINATSSCMQFLYLENGKLRMNRSKNCFSAFAFSSEFLKSSIECVKTARRLRK